MDWPSGKESAIYAPFIPNSEAWFALTHLQPDAISTAWGTANLAVFTPVYIPDRRDVTHLYVFNGATAAGNLDVGLYEAAPDPIFSWLTPAVRLGSSGSIAQAGTNAWQEVNIVDLPNVGPGWYFLALALNGTSGTVMRLGGFNGVAARGYHMHLGHCLGQNSAFPLPATAAAFDINGIFSNAIPMLALGRVT